MGVSKCFYLSLPIQILPKLYFWIVLILGEALDACQDVRILDHIIIGGENIKLQIQLFS